MTVNTDAPAYMVDGVLTDSEAWVPLATATPSSANVSFTSSTGANDWSQYQDFVIIAYVRSVGTGTWKDINMQLNNDTGSSYANVDFYGNGTSVSTQETNPVYTGLAYIAGADATANVFSTVIYNLYDINSGKYSLVSTQCAADGGNPSTVWLEVGFWESQAALTEIDLISPSGFAAGSRIDLFGVLPRMVTA
jgi:hypothetical protein